MDLPIYRGDSLSFLVTLIDQATGAPIALTGLTGRASIRKAKDDPTEYPLTVTVSQDAAGGATTGQISVSADGQTTFVLPQIGVWDLQLDDGSPAGVFRKTVVAGRVRFDRDVTIQGGT
jgi:hypothetical protein